jgi:septum site-determining protein MinD
MGKVYVVISGKGGVGKTTSTINLGFSVNEMGKEVIIVDANLTTPNVGLHLGSPIVPVTLNHVIADKAKVEEAIYEHESGAKILPASLAIGELKNIDHNKLGEITKKLKKIADHIFLDSSAGLGEEAQSSMRAADQVIIITNPEISAVTDALKTIKLAEQMNKEVIGAIITRHEDKDWEMPLDSIKDMLEVPILGIIPEDDSVKESQRMKNAVIHTHPKSKASKAYRKIAQRIVAQDLSKDERRKLKDKEKRDSEGFFGRLARRLGLKK